MPHPYNCSATVVAGSSGGHTPQPSSMAPLLCITSWLPCVAADHHCVMHDVLVMHDWRRPTTAPGGPPRWHRMCIDQTCVRVLLQTGGRGAAAVAALCVTPPGQEHPLQGPVLPPVAHPDSPRYPAAAQVRLPAVGGRTTTPYPAALHWDGHQPPGCMTHCQYGVVWVLVQLGSRHSPCLTMGMPP